MANTTNHEPVYGDDVRNAILRRIAAGEWMNSICRDDYMPSVKTVDEWAKEEEWGESLARAREAGYDARAERLLRLAADDERDPAHKKIEIETERWLLARQAPAKYGDRTAHQMLDERGKPAKAGVTIIIDGAKAHD